MASNSQRTEAEHFLLAHPDIKTVDLLIADINGLQRGKRIHADKLLSIYEQGVCLPSSIFGMNITGDTCESTGLGMNIGDADKFCFPVANSLKSVPWYDIPMAQVLLHMYEPDGNTPFFANPRQVLQQVLARFEALGLTPVVAVELEFYLLDAQRSETHAPQPAVSPVTGQRAKGTQVYGIQELDEFAPLLREIAEAAAIQDIPADTASSEYAPAQYEINLYHRPDPVAACDDAFELKRLVKAIAQKYNMEATFMAKPYQDLSGNGLHIHLSLLDADGNNIFSTEPHLVTQQPFIRHAIAGLNALMAESMAIFAPNANSYRRFQANTFVPLSPSWGVNNRTTALRIPISPPEATRIEHRVAGADANPYLVMAAMLASVHYGLTQKLEPVPAIEGDAYTQCRPSLPNTWVEALTLFQQSRILPSYLGLAFSHVYSAAKEEERASFNAHVSLLEYEWYLRL